MRISMSRSSVPSPCAVFDGGEVEDYSVSLIETLPDLPVAEFTASPLIITPGGSVNFTDISTGNPVSWEWAFTGGEPSYSNLQNPVVIYNSPGIFDVSLTVSNSSGSDNIVKQGYITVTEEIIPDVYCVPVAVNSSSDWISKVEIGTALQNNSFGNGYSLFPSTVALTPGQAYAVSLVPFNGQNKNFWRLWIDFNSDGDFSDADETLVTGNNIKGTLSASITIPSYAKGVTRMRVIMRNGSAPSPCDDNFYGEVEDYDVSFSNPASVLKSGNTEGPLPAVDFRYKIYPNPAVTTLWLQIDAVGVGDYLKIYNSAGQMIRAEKISSTVTAIHVENLVSGLYYLSVINNGRIWQAKFVKTGNSD
jgi:PKD repeat protein